MLFNIALEGPSATTQPTNYKGNCPNASTGFQNRRTAPPKSSCPQPPYSQGESPTVRGSMGAANSASTTSRMAMAWSPYSSRMSKALHSTYAGRFFKMGAEVLPSKNGSSFNFVLDAFDGLKNFCAMSLWPTPRTCRAAIRLSRRQRKTLLSFRTATISKGGLNDDCETHETVAAPS